MQFVSLANNHCLDYGQAGLLETQQALDEAGIAHAGRCCYLCNLACTFIFSANQSLGVSSCPPSTCKFA